MHLNLVVISEKLIIRLYSVFSFVCKGWERTQRKEKWPLELRYWDAVHTTNKILIIDFYETNLLCILTSTVFKYTTHLSTHNTFAGLEV